MKKTIIIITALALCSACYGKSAKKEIEEIAQALNTETPFNTSNGIGWILDSVRYDKKSNIFSYYYSSPLIYDDIMTASLKDISNDVYALQICSNMTEQNKEAVLFKKAGTNLRFIYKKSTGEEIRTYNIENKNILRKYTQAELKEVDKLIMVEIAQNTNRRCPWNIDPFTTMTSCYFDEENYIITYTYAVSLGSQKIMDRFEEKQKIHIAQNIRNNNSNEASFKRNNVTYKYKYVFNEKETREIVINPIDYK